MKLNHNPIPYVLVGACVGALLGLYTNSIEPTGGAKIKSIDSSLTFTATNRLVITHYIIIPATPSDWSALTSRYPANVTRTTLKFE